MQLRRTFALVTGALVLCVPVLSSCGFGLATDRVNAIQNGANFRGGEVDVLGAVIVAESAGSGTFIATLSNNSATADASFDSLTGVSGASGDDVTATAFEPYDLDPQGYVSLSEAGGVKLSGDFGAGDYVELTLGFADGDDVDINVPVVTNCHYYEGLDGSASAGASESASEGASEGATVSETPAPTGAATLDATPSAAASTEASEPSESSSAYSCEYAQVPENDPAVPGETLGGE